MSCTFPLLDSEPCRCATAEPRAALLSFARWLFPPDLPETRLQPLIALALDEPSECIPRMMLEAVRKMMLVDLYSLPPFTETAAKAFRGYPVPSWPDGEIRSGVTWNEMFTR